MSNFANDLSELSDESISSVVTDPTEHTAETWEECFRVLKPGGYLLAFSDTIKYHRLAVAVEDAGFEIRDSLHWVFGKDGVQHRVIVMARKPLIGTVIETILAHRTGGINIDASRVGAGGEAGTGRFPTNTLFTHSPGCSMVGTKTETMNGGFGNGAIGFGGGDAKDAEWQQKETSSLVFECAPVCPVRTLDEQSGIRKAGHWTQTTTKGFGEFGGGGSTYHGTGPKSPDGGASNFFKQTQWGPLDTDKPLELMAYLLRMVTPPGGRILDPYLRDGDTAVAAALCGYEWVGVAEASEVISSRLAAITIHETQPDS